MTKEGGSWGGHTRIAPMFRLASANKAYGVNPHAFGRVEALPSSLLDGVHSLPKSVSVIPPSSPSNPLGPSIFKDDSTPHSTNPDGGKDESVLIIDKQLGKGGTGEVCSAIDSGTGARLALKVSRAGSEDLAREALVYAAILEPLGLATTLRFHGYYRSDVYGILVMDRGPPPMGEFADLSPSQKFARLLLFLRTHVVDKHTRA